MGRELTLNILRNLIERSIYLIVRSASSGWVSEGSLETLSPFWADQRGQDSRLKNL